MWSKFIKNKKHNKSHGVYKYKDYIEIINKNGRRLIAGYLIMTNELVGIDPRVKYYYIYKSYQNFIEALNRTGIPILLIYESGFSDSGSASYILTFGKEEDELRKRLEIIRSSFMAVFPNYQLIRLSSGQVISLKEMDYASYKESSNAPTIFISERFPQPTRSSCVIKPDFYIPLKDETEHTDIILGKIENDNKSIIYGFQAEHLKRHLVCFGVTGSGKTTTITTILNQIRDIKFLVLDFHNEYSQMLSNNHIIIRPGMKGELTFNPINPIRIEDRDEHIAVITDIFSDTYGFTHPQSYLFKLSLEATLENYDMTGEKEPNLTALIKMIEKYPLKSYYDLETKAALMRRLTPLIKGQARNAFIGDKRISMEKILSTNVVIELGHLRETKTREIYSQLLLKQLYDYRLMSGPSIFNHITVVEEARYIVPTRRSYDPPSTMERMIGELRKFGESIFIVSQFPSQISHEVVKNAAIHIYHRIIGMEDLKIIANSAPLSQSQIEHLKKLDTGEAIIKDFRYRDPVLIKVVPRIK